MILDNNIFEIAPGEDKSTKPFWDDASCEEQAFPNLFPLGQFGFSFDRDVKIQESKYFNQRLLNLDSRFSSNTDYIFYALTVLQEKMLRDQISIALKKSSHTYTASNFRDYKNAINNCIAENQGFLFMKNIRGSPAYWKNFQMEVLSMIKQLGCPDFFLTLSCADLKWKDLVTVINKAQNLNLDEKCFEKLNYFERSSILNKSPVLVVRHFQHRVELFFRELLLNANGPLGLVKYYAIRVEFQIRGSPHIHSFLWMNDPMQFSETNEKEYVSYLESKLSVNLPALGSIYYDPVKTFQVHSHWNSCRKYKNQDCRFNFGKYFTKETIISKPLENVSKLEKFAILSKRNEILNKVSCYINSTLHPSNPNFKHIKSIPEILNSLNISEEDYSWALSISETADIQIHMKRSPDSCFVNSYNPELLLAWQANIDIQPVYNFYKAVSYMTSYFSKSETQTSEALKQAVKEINHQKLAPRQAMSKMAHSFLSSRQISVQEAVYFCLPEMWYRKCVPGCLFVNTNLPEKRFRMLKSEKEISELPDDSSDIYKTGIIDDYCMRPEDMSNVCLAQFASFYQKTLPETHEYQPNNLLLKEKVNSDFDLPKIIKLANGKKLKKRSQRYVLRYYTPNKHLYPELYSHHMLMLFHPFQKEADIKLGFETYCEKLAQFDVLDTVNFNRRIFEPNADLIDNVYDIFSRSSDESENLMFDEILPSNTDCSDNFPQMTESQIPCGSNSLPSYENDNIFSKIRSLNNQQRSIFNNIVAWSRNYIKSRNSKALNKVTPLRYFITGGAGVGKSHLIKTITLFLQKSLSYHSCDHEKPKVLLLAPTGVSAINIGGTTIHSGLGIPPTCNSYNLPKLPDVKKANFRVQYSEVKAIVIDEISMVSNVTLLHIHKRLCEIFGCSEQQPFANMTVFLVGDLLQLPAIRSSQIYSSYNSAFGDLYNLWHLFTMCELTEIMRQKGDLPFINLLNNVRKGVLTKENKDLLETRVIEATSVPDDCTVLFSENLPKDEYNKTKLESLPHTEISISAIDMVETNGNLFLLDHLKQLRSNKTGNLSSTLSLKKGARIMLTANIDVGDRLINGQMGNIVDFCCSGSKISKVYIKLDDKMAGHKAMSNDEIGQKYGIIPIFMVEAHFSIKYQNVTFSCKRTQFPLTLAYSCTVHKVQGLTLSKVAVSFELFHQKSFNPGQIYVALSRATSLDNLFIIGIPSSEAITCSQPALKEYERLRNKANFFEQGKYMQTPFLTYLNIASLKKHLNDFALDSRVNVSAILCFTETRLSRNQNLDFKTYFPNYQLLRNDNEDTFQSLAIAFNDGMFNFYDCNYLDGILVVILQNRTTQTFLNILLLYRKISLDLSNFLERLKYLVIRYEIDIVIGDFNEIFFVSELSKRLFEQEGMKQIVTDATHIRGSLIDHAYVKNSLSVTSNVVPIYYSDHDALLLYFD